MAIYMGVTTVVTGGSGGPLLGDGVKTTAVVQNSVGTNFTQFLNQATRQGFSVARILLFAKKANAGDIYFGGAGVTAATGVPLGPREMLPIGTGQVNNVNVGDLDIDADTSSNAVFWVMEVD